MYKLLHPFQVFRAVRCGLRWRLKRALRIPDKPQSPVVDGNPSIAFERHQRICRLVLECLPSIAPENRSVACEIGSGDCLAVADLLLGSGFERIYLVEKQPILLSQRQKAILTQLSTTGSFPNKLDVFEAGQELILNENRVKIIPEFFESARLPEKVDFVFSHDVVEHVEDLDGFFRHCSKIIKPGGIMVHKFDLSGHEFFEDPMPPLDFQTYPVWLYTLMFPKYRRACRWFLDEILAAARRSNFVDPSIAIVRSAQAAYTDEIRPLLRYEARMRSHDELAPLDVIVTWKNGV